MQTPPRIEQNLEFRKKHGLYRQLIQPRGIDFSSNDYLGLSKSDSIRAELIDALKQGVDFSGTSSRLITGNTDIHVNTERKLADFLNREASLLFSTGYMANEGVISCFGKNSLIFSDELNHSSIINGIRLSKSECKTFKHNDVQDLYQSLKDSDQKQSKLIIVESVYSMDGDLAPLQAIADIAAEFDALLIVDEAHATGVFGDHGEGLVSGLTNHKEMTLSIHTGGKALACTGAFVGLSEKFKEFIINNCAHFIYTTAISALQCIHLAISTREVSEQENLRKDLFSNIHRFNPDGTSPIQPHFMSGNGPVIELSEKLLEHGYHVKPIRYPTVARGTERLRISIHANHSFDQIDQLKKLLAQDDV